MTETKGVCFFAYNNEAIDYIELAILAAAQAKKHLDLPITVITDAGTYNWLKQKPDGVAQAKKFIDNIIITEEDLKLNHRKHWDSPWSSFNAPFFNSNKHKIWEYSPYEQTLLLDIDYMIRSDSLLQSFSHEGVCMFDEALDLRSDKPGSRERYLFDGGIPMWWSTVVYFDRTSTSKLFFDTWAHVADNYEFYQYLYNFPGRLFRTDYCVSIAVHILNGMTTGDSINNFPGALLNMDQKDDIVEIRENDWIMLSNDKQKQWQNIVVKVTDQDIHCMNKRAILRHTKQIWETNT